MPRPPPLNPADVDRLVKRELGTATQAVAKALRAVEQTHTTRSRRVARHLASALRMLQDTGRVTSPYDVVDEQAAPLPDPVPPPTPTPPVTEEVEASDE